MIALLSRRRFELVALSIAAVLCALHWWSDVQPVGEDGPGTSLLARGLHILEGRATDMQFRARGRLAPHPDVLVAVVDEKSAQKYGLWPWRRSLVAQALRKLHEGGVAAVGMDMFFPDEVKDTAAETYAQVLAQLDDASKRARPEAAEELVALRTSLHKMSASSPDAELAAAFAQVPEIVQGVRAYGPEERDSFSAKEAQFAALMKPRLLTTFPAANGLSMYPVTVDAVASFPKYSAQMPLAIFASQSQHFGHFNAEPDPDGILRRLPIFVKLVGPQGLLPSLDLATAAVALKATIEPIYDPAQGRLVGARLRAEGQPPRVVPIELAEPATLINHLGPSEVFPQVSLADVIDGQVPAAQLKGKAVLLGVNLIGLFDQRATPFREDEAGIFSHASMLSNILSGDYLTRPWELRLFEVVFMLGAALMLALFLPQARFALKLAAVAGLAVGWLALDQLLFVRAHLQLSTVLPVASVLLSGFGVLFVGYLSTDREKGVLRSAFQHYLNASVMDQMLAHPEKLKLGGEKKEMTVLFSDIRGFTTLSERMAPEALVKFINSYLTPMTRIVFDEGGTLDKYIGDALMAFWGAPIEQDDHALRACRAAVRFLDKLKELKLAWRDQSLPEFDIGVGINTGPMIVGNMGSDVRFDYTVMGDAVNLASRLEGTNKEYETRVMISEATYLQVKDHVVARRLGAVRVKGKRKPVRVYELRALGQAAGTDAEAISAFEAALDLYTEGRFVDAEGGFQRVLTLWPQDPPAHRYLEELSVLKTRPVPPTWDGVYTATSK